VVLLGAFNPTIFQPRWFASQGLLSQGEADSAEIQIIHPQVCQFNTEGFYLQVTPDRFLLGSKPDAVSEPVRDLASGTFFILEHTPLTALGINRQMHFKLRSETEWHRLGDKLTPKEPWKGLLPSRPGMETIQISSIVPDQPSGTMVNVIVQPSKHVTHGAYFEVNNQYRFSSAENARQECLDILKKDWTEKQAYALTIARSIISWSEE